MADLKLFLVVVLGVARSALGQDFDEAVRQNYQTSTHDAVKALAHKYTDIAETFQGYATFLKEADVSLHCFAKWAGRLSNELWRQRELLINHAKSRGGYMKYNSPNLQTACTAVIAETDARLGDSSDTTTRMCICERLLSPTAVLSGRTCPSHSSGSPKWKHGLMVVEDALAALKYMMKHSAMLANTAENAQDGSLMNLMRHKLVGKLRDEIAHTARHVTTLRRVSAANYFLGEEMYDKEVMCSEDLNVRKTRLR